MQSRMVWKVPVVFSLYVLFFLVDVKNCHVTLNDKVAHNHSGGYDIL